ncbi:hypothetical protein BGY98DRAFT_328025 [Russula aff. rugulosa BPL654]|nr:hypothetical protein BGY98DRAFT_328025 [Russula aff. rugulosa BPL654]
MSFGVLPRTGLLFLIRLAPSISMSRMTLASGCVGSRLAVLSLLSPPQEEATDPSSCAALSPTTSTSTTMPTSNSPPRIARC